MSQTISDALTNCGVLSNTTGIVLNGNISADMIAAYVFNENFNTCVDIKFSELEYNWKTYRRLTVAEERISLRPRTKVDIREFVQCTRGEVRQDEDPILTLFPLNDRDDLIERFKTHNHWLEDVVNMGKTL